MKIISSKQYKEYQQLKSIAVANEVAEIFVYCRDNKIQLWGWVYPTDKTINLSAKYDGVETKIDSLEKLKQFKKMSDEFNNTYK